MTEQNDRLLPSETAARWACPRCRWTTSLDEDRLHADADDVLDHLRWHGLSTSEALAVIANG